MRPSLSSNAAQILAKMQRRKQAVSNELEKAARALGPELSAEAKKIQQERIYNVPIPARRTARNAPKTTTKGKAGQWQRTGNLKRSEGWRVEGVTLWLTNNAEYAGARYALGTPGGRRIITPSVQSVQWHAEAITKKRERILEVRRRALLRALQ